MEVVTNCDNLFYSTKPAISWYNYNMNHKPLIETNPYLRNPKKYEELLIINVGSSTAIELEKADPSLFQVLKDTSFPLLIKFGNNKLDPNSLKKLLP